jgi:thiamine-phosphate pyrophosphorylase
MRLYAVTDRQWLKDNSLADVVEKAILEGVTFVQLREKDILVEEFLILAKEIKKVTDKYKIPFVVNDNVDVAISVQADGVHVGQEDMKASKVRELLGNEKILGVSVQTVEQAIQAEKEGADYLGVGAVFSTDTKSDAIEVSYDTLKAICESVHIPVVAIGGIHKENILTLKGSMVDGIAVISAIFASEDIGESTKELRTLSDQIVRIKEKVKV